MDSGSGRSILLPCLLVSLRILMIYAHTPISCTGGNHDSIGIDLELFANAPNAQAPCTGYLTYQSTRFCGGMDDEAAERACYERGVNYEDEEKRYHCKFYSGSELDDAQVSTNYALLSDAPTHLGFTCPAIGTPHCFADCYFDSGTTIIADSGTGTPPANCGDNRELTAIYCIDVDECRDGALRVCHGAFDHDCYNRSACGPMANCQNTPGSYSCSCPAAWNGAGSDANDLNIGCLDTNECADDPDICDGDDIQCQNLPGTYVCICPAGWVWEPNTYRGNGEHGACVVQVCPASPTTIPNGVRTSQDANYPGSTVYTCDNGYTPSHGSIDDRTFSMDCRPDGQWCPCTSPNCERVPCGYPSIDPNAAMIVTGQGVFEDTAEYTCPSGFATSTGSTTYSRTCQNDGTWSTVTVSCEDIDECALLNSCPDDSVCYNTIGSYYCVCNPGYTGSGVAGSPCTPINCGGSPVIDNGQQTTNLGVSGGSFGDQVDYRCLDGFRATTHREWFQPVYAFSLVCREDGVWEPSPHPECIPISCGDPRTMAHAGRSGNSFFFGDTVSFTCCDGFRPNTANWNSGSVYDDIDITCQADGKWSGGAVCEDVDECTEYSSPPCGLGNHHCINTAGSYRCDCDAGYREDRTATTCVRLPVTPTRPCDFYQALNLCPFGSCEVVDGYARCRCQDGYFGQFCTDDSEELSDNLSQAFLLALISWGMLGLLIFLMIIMCIALFNRHMGLGPRGPVRPQGPRPETFEIIQAPPAGQVAGNYQIVTT